ncbi:unnamed protein product, partial [Polarella glacialis]
MDANCNWLARSTSSCNPWTLAGTQKSLIAMDLSRSALPRPSHQWRAGHLSGIVPPLRYPEPLTESSEVARVALAAFATVATCVGFHGRRRSNSSYQVARHLRPHCYSERTLHCTAAIVSTDAARNESSVADELQGSSCSSGADLSFVEGDLLLHIGGAGAVPLKLVLEVALEEVRALLSLVSGHSNCQLRPAQYAAALGSRENDKNNKNNNNNNGDGENSELQDPPMLWVVSDSGLSEQQVMELASRCVLVRAVYKPIACSLCVDDLAAQGLAVVKGWTPERRSGSWRLRIRGVHQRYNLDREEACDVLEESLLLLGPVRLEAPDLALAIVQEFDPKGCSLTPHRLWLVLEFGKPTSWLAPYLLKKRPYCSTSTLQPEISFIMANLARVSLGDSVLDPLCGSCSLLLAAAANGAARTQG